ncbi:hypothetical protein CEXT_665161 [Caerostris extrusa]|uniref:Uncharacterized protein n=1 Tax=Caerostris extrusa TaxID=172846 RepID=A0AAV4RKJ2_CAEEX|nr:hypothetical protein CEXT_665161 [Caerostris extrusa]
MGRIKPMNYCCLGFWISACCLGLASTGNSLTKDFNYTVLEENTLSDIIEVVTLNYSEISITDKTDGTTRKEDTTSHPDEIRNNTRKRTRVAVLSEKDSGHAIMPLAAGGLALLGGLLLVSVVVGLFMYCNRNTGYVYEPALTSDVSTHI